MSTPLVTALRESCGYLSDGGYRQTAQLLTLAADEIERLDGELQALRAASRATTPRLPAQPGRHAARAARPPVPSAGR